MVNTSVNLPPAAPTHGHGAATQVADSGSVKAPPVRSGGTEHNTIPGPASRETTLLDLPSMDRFACSEMLNTTKAVNAFQKVLNRPIAPGEKSPEELKPLHTAAVAAADENLATQLLASKVKGHIENDAKIQLNGLKRSHAPPEQIRAARTKYDDAKAAHDRSLDAVAQAEELRHIYTVDANKLMLDDLTKTRK